jgi:hypothetical protein
MKTPTRKDIRATAEAVECCRRLLDLAQIIELHPNNMKKLLEIDNEVSWLNHLANHDHLEKSGVH